MNILIHTDEVPEFPHMFSDEDLHHIADALGRATRRIVNGDTEPDWRIRMRADSTAVWFFTEFQGYDEAGYPWQPDQVFIIHDDAGVNVLPDRTPA